MSKPTLPNEYISVKKADLMAIAAGLHYFIADHMGVYGIQSFRKYKHYSVMDEPEGEWSRDAVFRNLIHTENIDDLLSREPHFRVGDLKECIEEAGGIDAYEAALKAALEGKK